jgi:hypothetical protein
MNSIRLHIKEPWSLQWKDQTDVTKCDSSQNIMLREHWSSICGPRSLTFVMEHCNLLQNATISKMKSKKTDQSSLSNNEWPRKNMSKDSASGGCRGGRPYWCHKVFINSATMIYRSFRKPWTLLRGETILTSQSDYKFRYTTRWWLSCEEKVKSQSVYKFRHTTVPGDHWAAMIKYSHKVFINSATLPGDDWAAMKSKVKSQSVYKFRHTGRGWLSCNEKVKSQSVYKFRHTAWGWLSYKEKENRKGVCGNFSNIKKLAKSIRIFWLLWGRLLTAKRAKT